MNFLLVLILILLISSLPAILLDNMFGCMDTCGLFTKDMYDIHSCECGFLVDVGVG